MLTRDQIEAVRRAHPIIGVLERLGIEIPTRQGTRRDFEVHCPNPSHPDTTPSCLIHPDTDRYYCFGCGAHGDVFDLVRLATGARSFADALTFLDSGRSVPTIGKPRVAVRHARSDGIDLTRTPAERILEINQLAWEIMTTPAAHMTATRYVERRGIDLPTLERRAGEPLAGYAPALRTGLVDELRANGCTDVELIDAGWAISHDERLIDRFHRRVIFPVRDTDWQVVGVTGRDLTDAARAKYLNSPTTAAYRKADHLYQPLVQTQPRADVVLCEGPFDALAIALAAEKALPLAVLGTSLTDGQIEQVRRLQPTTVYLAADGDAAGASASQRWAQALQLVALRSQRVHLPRHHDPASYLRPPSMR